MRLVRVEGDATGLLVGEGDDGVVVDVVASLDAVGSDDPDGAQLLGTLLGSGQTSWLGLIEHWAEAGEALRAIEELAASGADSGLAVRLAANVALGPPVPDPGSRIFALGGNFPTHVAGADSGIDLPDSIKHGTKDDTPPWGFYVIPGTIVGPDALVTPPGSVQKLDYEAEVAVVLAADGDPARADGLRIWGYTAWNDFSIRDPAFGLSKTDHGLLTWSLTKNFETGNACGPAMVVDEPADDLRIVCRVNGDVRQDDSTRNMTYGFGDVAEHICEYVDLGAGDMIVSGTPAGTAMEGGADGPFLQDGDVTEVDVQGVGVLRNRVALAG